MFIWDPEFADVNAVFAVAVEVTANALFLTSGDVNVLFVNVCVLVSVTRDVNAVPESWITAGVGDVFEYVQTLPDVWAPADCNANIDEIPEGTAILNPLLIFEITGLVNVLFVKVSVVFFPTSRNTYCCGTGINANSRKQYNKKYKSKSSKILKKYQKEYRDKKYWKNRVKGKSFVTYVGKNQLNIISVATDNLHTIADCCGLVRI